ncbi:MAG: AtpZ/AtpI family protein [Planctomycetota bacterium]
MQDPGQGRDGSEPGSPKPGSPKPGPPKPGPPKPGPLAADPRTDHSRADHSRTDDVPFAPDGDWVREQKSSFQYAGVGMQFGFTICIFALVGNWMDGRFGTAPWLLLVGVLLGFGGGTYSLLKKFSNGA